MYLLCQEDHRKLKAELMSRKLFANLGNMKRGNKKPNIFEKIDVKKIVEKDTVIDIFKNIN